MKKQLSEMTLEELWQLFPIILTEHNPAWADWYGEERLRLAGFLPMEKIARMSHIGSTAIPAIWAKPTVDILVETDDPAALKEPLRAAGYNLMSESSDRLSFNRGYTPDGFAERVFHLHARGTGDHDELYFRDYLNDHPDAARRYEARKLSLWRPYEHDRDGYTREKTALVAELTALAKAEYTGRYE